MSPDAVEFQMAAAKVAETVSVAAMVGLVVGLVVAQRVVELVVAQRVVGGPALVLVDRELSLRRLGLIAKADTGLH